MQTARAVAARVLKDRKYCTKVEVKSLSALEKKVGISSLDDWYQGQLQSADVQRECLLWIGKQLGVVKLDDWYSISTNKVDAVAGSFLADFYSHSLARALKMAFPEHDWLEWKFEVLPPRFFEQEGNAKRFCEYAASHLNINKLNDWERVTREQVEQILGRKFRSIGLVTLLERAYPNHTWFPWKMKSLPKGYWQKVGHRRQFFDYLASVRLEMKTLDGWYGVSRDKAYSLGAGFLIKDYYEGSLHRALLHIYPEHDWLEWKFETVSSGYWQDYSNRKKYFEWLGKELGYRTMEDWYRLKRQDIATRGGNTVIRNYYQDSIKVALLDIFPEHNWEEWNI